MDPAEYMRVFKDLLALSINAADIFLVRAEARALRGEPFTIALAGGSTPRTLYRTLAAPPYSEKVPWEHVHLFFGDERCVGPDDEQSNFRMARDTLTKAVDIPKGNVHRIMGELDPVVAAGKYEEELREFFTASGRMDSTGRWPVFDMVLLGLGTDGHTLSLFPGSEALEERKKLVCTSRTSRGESPDTRRVTLTYSVVNSASLVVFLVSGTEKAAIVDRVLNGPYEPRTLPAQAVKPISGAFLWLLDRGAAGRFQL